MASEIEGGPPLSRGNADMPPAARAWRGGLAAKWPSIAVILFAQVTAMAV